MGSLGDNRPTSEACTAAAMGCGRTLKNPTFVLAQQDSLSQVTPLMRLTGRKLHTLKSEEFGHKVLS